jgi:hypothetical protein
MISAEMIATHLDCLYRRIVAAALNAGIQSCGCKAWSIGKAVGACELSMEVRILPARTIVIGCSIIEALLLPVNGGGERQECGGRRKEMHTEGTVILKLNADLY